MPFQFNVWSSLLLIGFIQGFVFSVMLLIRSIKNGRLSDRFAALILLIGVVYIAQWMLGFAGWYDSRDGYTTIMFYTPWRNLWLLGPFVWFYFQALTNAQFQWKQKYWIHLLPWVLNTLHNMYPFMMDIVKDVWLQGKELTFFDGSRGPIMDSRHNTAQPLYGILFYLEKSQIAIYLIITLLAYRKYKNYLIDRFSNIELLVFKPLFYWLVLFAGGVVLTLVLEIIARTFSFGYKDSWNHYFLMSMIVYVSSILFYMIDPYITRRLAFTVSDASDEEPVTDAEQVSERTTTEEPQIDPQWIPRIEKAMDQDQLFLRSDLSLGELAKHLGTNASVLSKVINGHYQLNFNDFINGYRCGAVKKAVDNGEHEQMTFLSLAMDAGFNSKSTFNRAFKKKYGISPGEYVKSLSAA